MRKSLLLLFLFSAFSLAAQTEPSYSEWNRILAAHYDPVRGMNYAALKARDGRALEALRQQLGRVDVATLSRKQQLAYWINVYNVNVVATVVEHYPVDSIRDISTDPIIRLNVFKKERVPFGGKLLSLDDVENEKIREGFHDPRIHFAINCAAKSCPPIRMEAFTGAKLDAQLDDQTRRFLARAVRVERDGNRLTVHTTKIMDWFRKDFEAWGGGVVPFVRKYVQMEQREAAVEYDDYDWSLNDAKR